MTTPEYRFNPARLIRIVVVILVVVGGVVAWRYFAMRGDDSKPNVAVAPTSALPPDSPSPAGTAPGGRPPRAPPPPPRRAHPPGAARLADRAPAGHADARGPRTGGGGRLRQLPLLPHLGVRRAQGLRRRHRPPGQGLRHGGGQPH